MDSEYTGIYISDDTAVHDRFVPAFICLGLTLAPLKMATNVIKTLKKGKKRENVVHNILEVRD